MDSQARASDLAGSDLAGSELAGSELAGALGPVVADLAGTGAVLPDVRPGASGVILYAPDGSGHGVSIMPGQTFAQQVAAVADRVQDWAVETLWSLGRSTTWPPCPRHPGTHPLTAAVVHDPAPTLPGDACAAAPGDAAAPARADPPANAGASGGEWAAWLCPVDGTPVSAIGSL